MAIVSHLELIRRVPLFALLPQVQAELVAGAVVKKRYKRGERLVEQGQQSQALLMILSGRARVTTANQLGREVILAWLGQGDCVGEMSLIDGQPHSATVEAEVQVDVLVLGKREFERCLQGNDAMAEAIMRELVRRLRHADRKIESLALLDVYERVARALIELAEQDAQGRLVVPARISRMDVAKTVGASREMVSRVMKEFTEREYIHMQDDGGLEIKNHLLNRMEW